VSRARPLAVRGFATGSRYRVTLARVHPTELTVADLTGLDERARDEVARLLARAAAADEAPPLPEPQLRAVSAPASAGTGWQLVMARRTGTVVGIALLSGALDGSTVVHYVVDPGARGEDGESLGAALVRRAVAEAPPAWPVHLWAMQAGPADDELAHDNGFSPERDLLQLRVALPLPPEVVAATRPLVTRPFEPGRDEAAWLETNNRAFAGHPEQGGWTLGQLRDRLAADWVELDGFLVADDPDGQGLIGSCWTKIHRGHRPVLGEIYVIAVDPRHHGQGWGRSLTVAGLESIARRGITVGMLYTDATNQAAVALYRSLGFTVDHTDRSYRHDPPGDA
jgi:mycothiol synthase